jgi:predicted RNase H-like nuclease (RuvC/YqgF family)
VSDDVKAEGSQEPPKPSTPQAGQTAPEPAPPVGRTLDADALAKELEETRKEAAKYRTERKSLADEMKALQAKLTAIETASLTEQEKKDKEYQRAQEQAAALAAQLAEQTKRNQELQARSIVQAAAARLGIVDPDAAFVLLRDTTKFKELIQA